MLLGNLNLSGTQYFFGLHSTKSADTYSLISRYHLEDVRNGRLDNPENVEIQDVNALKKYYSDDYLIESIKKSRSSGRISKYGFGSELEIVLDAIAFANSYSFKKENIKEKKREIDFGIISEVFDASDENISFYYEKEDGQYRKLFVKTPIVELDMHFVFFKVIPHVTYSEVTKDEIKRVMVSTIKTIKYEDLAESLDMSWYKKDGVIVKDYSNVKTIEEFELRVMTPLIEYVLECKENGCVADVSLDTETTGVAIYDLAKDNPDRSHVVSIQLSWKDDQGVAIFNDMEHFQNVSIEYVKKRLESLFQDFKGTRSVWYYKFSASGRDGITPLTAFADDASCLSKGADLSNYTKTTCEITRDLINLIGHNSPFDRRAMFGEGSDIWFNEDTLQLAFNLDPKNVRGSNKLKVLTRRVFGHETPELSDLLGKGNEDKYKYLVDEEVANIYGCADVDYTRKLKIFLKSLTNPSLYQRYKQQDIPLLNILAISEFYGLNMLQEPLEVLSNETYQNLEILKDAMYRYVGVFMDYEAKRQVIEIGKDAGMYSSDKEYLDAIKNIKVDPNSIYKFEFKASELRNVLYNVMKYPILAYTEGKQKLPKVDKYVIDKLLKKKADGTATRRLEHSILRFGCDRFEYETLLNGKESDKKKAKGMELISAEEFNSYKYPLALIIKKYSDLNKEYTSYFKPIKEQNLEGKIFKSYSMARIETRRISNPAQTMKGNLKALVRSYNDDYYMLDFDMSQIELRLMYSLSGFDYMIQRMKNPENDSHTETASVVNHIPPHKVTKKQRKAAKKVSFGVPYGLGDRSMCESMFDEVNKSTMLETRKTLHYWKIANEPIVNLLEAARDEALTECEISRAVRDFMDLWKKNKETGEYLLDDNGEKIPIPVSKVHNKFGFYRMFSLENVDLSDAGKKRRKTRKFDSVESSIRRAAGNYPIQSFAAEIFRIILIRFYNACVEEGIADKVKWHMLIHDELLCSVHKSVHPFLIYKIVKKACMITLKGHTNYFVGINIGKTWADCKNDDREAPVYFVDRIIKRYDAGEFRDKDWFDDPWEYIRPYREQYVEDRIGEVLRAVQPSVDVSYVDVPYLLEHFDNYTVRAYVNDYPLNFPVKKGDYKDTEDYDNMVWQSRLESWALKVFGEGKDILGADGVMKKLTAYKAVEEEKNVASEEDVFADELEEMFNDSVFEEERYYSYEDGDAESIYDTELVDASEDYDSDYDFDVDYSIKGNSLADMIIEEKKYQNIQEVNGSVVIRIPNDAVKKAIKSVLLKSTSRNGRTVMFKVGNVFESWIKISDSLDLFALDKQIDELKQNYSISDFKFVSLKSGCIFCSVKNSRCASDLKNYLAQFREKQGNPVIIKTPFDTVMCPAINTSVNLALIEKFIQDWR